MPKTLSAIDKLNSAISKKMDNSKENFKLFKTFGNPRDYISLGNYLLNAQLSGDLFKGMPNTRSLELAGKSGTGKTFLCLNMVKDEIDKGYHVYYVDTEGALDEDDLNNFGINPEHITHIRTIKTYEECMQFINNLIKGTQDIINDCDDVDDEPKVALFVDSIGMMNTKTALENALKGNYKEDMGKRAKLVRDLFRTVTLDLSNLGIPFVFTNHTANSLDIFAIDKEVMSSGEGPTFAASFITLLGKTNYMKEASADDNSKKKTGVILRAKSHKNRKVTPVEIMFHLSFKKGMNKFVGLEKYISWDNCGVDWGTIYSESEFEDKFKGKPPMNSKKDELRVDSWKKDGQVWYCVLNPNIKTLAVKDSCKNESPSDIYSDKIFTLKTLQMLNDNVIKDLFSYSKSDDTSDQISDMMSSVAEKSPKTKRGRKTKDSSDESKED